MPAMDTAGVDMREEPQNRRNKRRRRHEWQVFVAGCQRETAMLTKEAARWSYYTPFAQCMGGVLGELGLQRRDIKCCSYFEHFAFSSSILC